MDERTSGLHHQHHHHHHQHQHPKQTQGSPRNRRSSGSLVLSFPILVCGCTRYTFFNFLSQRCPLSPSFSWCRGLPTTVVRSGSNGARNVTSSSCIACPRTGRFPAFPTNSTKHSQSAAPHGWRSTAGLHATARILVLLGAEIPSGCSLSFVLAQHCMHSLSCILCFCLVLLLWGVLMLVFAMAAETVEK